jgi:hypothetical protein
MTSYRWTRHKTVDGAGNQSIGVAPISLWWLARAAAEETLQGSPMVAAWLTLFRSHLSATEHHDLRWGGDLAESAELRRSYSGLYGRFMARALLANHLGLDRFVSLKRNGIALPGSINVERLCDGDIPDWLAWDDRNRRFALCEAKGSLSANDFLTGNPPTCVRKGKEQFGRVTSKIAGHVVHPTEWVAASRWATDMRPGTPITLLWDPPVPGAPFDPQEAVSHREAITRSWLASIAAGFGRSSADDMLAAAREGRGLVVRAEPGAIPEERDWPRDSEVSDGRRAELVEESGDGSETVAGPPFQRPIGSKQEKIMSQDPAQDGIIDLASAPIYAGRDVLTIRPRETKPLERGFVVALATRFGIRPIRTQNDLDELFRVQDRARRLEEPAMLFGIPFNFDPQQPVAEDSWLDGAGIAPANDLAVFDLREITAQSDGKLTI